MHGPEALRRNLPEARLRKLRRSDVSRVGFFHDNNSRIVAQFPRELPVADIAGENFFRAVLQQTIGKTAAGCAKIEGDFSRDIDLKFLQRGFEFVAAAADEFFRRGECKLIGFANGIAGFARDLIVDANLSSENGAFGFLATVANPAIDESLVESGELAFGIAHDSGMCGVNRGSVKRDSE